MTPQEAREVLQEQIDRYGQEYDAEGIEALEMAIKSLEQQPSGDYISREAVIEHICENKECYKEECKGRTLKRCYDLQWVFDLPSVNPQEPKIDILDKIRAEIANYGAIWVEYTIPGHTDRDIEWIVKYVLRQAKEQVLDIIDKYKAESEEKPKKAMDIINDVMKAENIPYEGTDDR